jgi:hypothetical protein
MSSSRGFTALMIFNAALNLAATILLTASPDTIPTTVGFPLGRDTYALGYMLGAAEVGLAVMFFFGRKVRDTYSLRLVTAAGAAFHVASALAQLLALAQDMAGNAVWANITLRLVLAGLLLYYGFIRQPAADESRSRFDSRVPA